MKIRPGVLLMAVILAAAVQALVLLALPDEQQVRISLILQIALVLSFAWWSARASGTYLNAPLILVFVVFFWHSVLLAAMSFYPLPQFEYTGNIFTYGREFVPQAVALVSLSMVCLSAGVVGAFHQLHRRSANAPRAAATAAMRLSRTASMFAWTCLIAFTAITVAELIFVGAARFSMTYLETYLVEDNSQLERLYQAVKFFGVPILLMVFAARHERGVSVPALAVSGGLIFGGLLQGSRTIPFLYLAAVLVSIDTFARRLTFVEVAALLIGGSALSYVVDHARALGLGLSVFDLSRTGQSVDVLAIVSNAGATVKTILRTFEFTKETGLWYGQSILNAALYLAPKALVDGLGLMPGFVRPSEWVVAQSADIPVGQTIAYSLVAEAYLNFGYLGCLLFALVGWFVGRQYFRYVLTGDRMAWMSAFNVAVLVSLHMRNDLAASLRVLVYGQVLIWAMRRIDRRGVVIRWRRTPVAVGPVAALPEGS
jgi:O-antigen polysaccharide polymerase Wzy-like protein